jgi:hypothetical protein
LFEAFRAQKTGGISKNKLFRIIRELLSRAEETALRTFVEEHSDIYEQYFTTIKAANYSNTRSYNKN